MMRTTQLFNRNFFRFGIPFLLLISLIFFIKSSYFLANSKFLTLGISIDLLLIIPLIYFISIRKSTIPKTTVIPIMILGLLVGMYFLPETNQHYLQLFKSWVLPFIEVGIAVFVISKVRKAILIHRKQHDASLDFYTTLKKTCAEILPKPVVVPFATEIAVFYYGFVYWKRKKLAHNEFSYHKESGSLALFFVLILLIGIEITPIHHLLAKWNVIAAWILTILSLYSGIQVFGYAKSLMKRPIEITHNTLKLRYGIMQEAEIPVSEIQELTQTSRELKKEDQIIRLSVLGELESHNILIETTTEQTLFGLFGSKKTFTKIALHIDKPTDFIHYIKEVQRNEL